MSGPTLGSGKWRVVLALAILLAIAAWIKWDQVRCKLFGACPTRPEMSLVKCPTHPFALELAQGFDHALPTTRILYEQALAGPWAAVTEVQDCQRLVLQDPEGTLRFGPLAALFASEQLGTQFGDAASGGGTYGDDRAAAQIYSDGAYLPLGISEGSSCLYVTRIVRADTSYYTARMQRALTDEDCLGRFNEARGGKNLVVRELGLPKVDPKALPVAARWAGGGRAGTHHISLRCGDSWCLVGEPGFTSEMAPPSLPTIDFSRYPGARLAPANLQEVLARVVLVPGWHDQQHLAVVRDGQLHPSPVRATLVPHPLLGNLTDDAELSADWVDVAYAWLPDTVEGYAEKLNFKRGWNTIAYRQGTATAVLAGVEPKRACPTERGPGIGDWWARITAADGTQAFFCVTKFAHSGLDLPGLVRWRWMEDDETTWIRCPGGCCPVE